MEMGEQRQGEGIRDNFPASNHSFTQYYHTITKTYIPKSTPYQITHVPATILLPTRLAGKTKALLNVAEASKRRDRRCIPPLVSCMG